MGSPTNEVREWTVPHLQLSPTTLWDQVGHEAPEIDHAAVPEVSPHAAASNQALPSPRSLMMTRKQAANAPCEDEDVEANKGEVEVLSNGQVASDGEEGQGCPPIQDTLTGISQVFGTHKDFDLESDPGEKIQSGWRKRCQPSPQGEHASQGLK